MDGMQLMATAMHAAQARLDVSASNLANVSSAGFHRHVARATLTSNGLVASSRVDATQGALVHTGRALDLAVSGAGGFAVRGSDGTVGELHSASFERNARGELVDRFGRSLLGAHGPIVLPPDATIDVARLRTSPGTTIESGYLEGPNVDAVREMVDVLGEQRAFETAQKTLVAIDDTRQKDVNDVARVK